MKKISIFLGYILFVISIFAQTEKQYVTIRGKVTDFENHPLDSVSVSFKHSDFTNVCSTLTDSDGYYQIKIPKGKYKSVTAINMTQYPTASPQIPEEDQRLEFWGWNFIADKDTTFDMHYHRMEAYGIRIFQIPGAFPSYVIYVRPMSLTRFQKESKNKAGEFKLSPAPENLGIKVTIDNKEVAVLMKQEVKEYAAPDKYVNAYLLTVGSLPENDKQPYHIFKIQLTDLENGDQGEGIYYFEKENYL